MHRESCVAIQLHYKDHSRCVFFNDTATTGIYTRSLHDALPISGVPAADERHVAGLPTAGRVGRRPAACRWARVRAAGVERGGRSEKHTSELQSRQYLVCRLLLEKKNKADVWTLMPAIILLPSST